MRVKHRDFFRLGAKCSSWLGLSLVACSCSFFQATIFSTKTMKLESSAFTHNDSIPFRYTCDGEDISPPLNWSEPPTGTKSLVLIVDDPDAPKKTWVHWVVYNLSPTTRSLPEKVTAENLLSGGALEGINDFGKMAYGGPCPPGGTHRYFFKLYALDTMLAINAGATKETVEAAIKGHILAQAESIGRYSRQ